MRPALCLLLALLCGCARTEPAPPTVLSPPVEQDAPPVTAEPPVEQQAEPDALPAASLPETEPPAEPDAPDGLSPHEEGDIDHDTLAQISALEQSTQVRDDDVAPVESGAYCRLTVTVEALLPRRDALPDVPLPPDGVFYSGTIVLSGGETALDTAAVTLTACGLACTLDGGEIQQIAGIPNDLQEDMRWVVRCNGELLEDPASYALQTGDALTLAYEPR